MTAIFQNVDAIFELYQAYHKWYDYSDEQSFREGVFYYWHAMQMGIVNDIYQTIRLPSSCITSLIRLIELKQIESRLSIRPCNVPMKELIDAQKTLLQIAKDAKNLFCYFGKEESDKTFCMPKGNQLTENDLNKIRDFWVFRKCNILFYDNDIDKLKEFYKLVLLIANELVMKMAYAFNYLLFIYRVKNYQPHALRISPDNDFLSVRPYPWPYPRHIPDRDRCFLNYLNIDWNFSGIEIDKETIYRPSPVVYTNLIDFAQKILDNSPEYKLLQNNH